ncbi:MAG: radical SAM protein, partial [Parasporobacterium sp.]|nr:radical SAM protein [Parasporobacterium sp.]
LIDVIGREEKICNYLDMPIQHASDEILRRMGRHTDQNAIRELIGRLRKKIPDICIRTTLISGFPGETQEDHAELMAFVKDMQFDRLGVFTYSREEGTPAYDFDGQIDETTAMERMDAIMTRQREISQEKNRAFVGKKMRVLIEGHLENEDAYMARTYRDAPDVDGSLFIQTKRELMSGDLVDVIVTGAHEYDLIGELADESAE